MAITFAVKNTCILKRFQESPTFIENIIMSKTLHTYNSIIYNKTLTFNMFDIVHIYFNKTLKKVNLWILFHIIILCKAPSLQKYGEQSLFLNKAPAGKNPCG